MEKTLSFRADLHCHSIHSDGSLSPGELFQAARAARLQGLSITDHDTTAAYNLCSFQEAEKWGITLLPGVEISTLHRGKRLHLLGYSFSLAEGTALQGLLQEQRKKRRVRIYAMLQRLSDLGIALTCEELEKERGGEGSFLGRPDLAQLLWKKRWVSSPAEAYHRYIGDGAPCYVEGDYCTTQEAIALLHEAGGVAVIAHPHLIRKREEIIALESLPIDGLEVYYSRMSSQMCAQWKKLAYRKGWLQTGGSDFHGVSKPKTSLGSSWIHWQTFSHLHTLFCNNAPSLNWKRNEAMAFSAVGEA